MTSAVGSNYTRAPSADDVHWQLKGRCSTGKYDKGWWEGLAEGENAASKHHREKLALQVCATCPVLEKCREWALTHDELWGTWGGMTDTERRHLRYPSQAPAYRRNQAKARRMS